MTLPVAEKRSDVVKSSSTRSPAAFDIATRRFVGIYYIDVDHSNSSSIGFLEITQWSRVFEGKIQLSFIQTLFVFGPRRAAIRRAKISLPLAANVRARIALS